MDTLIEEGGWPAKQVFLTHIIDFLEHFMDLLIQEGGWAASLPYRYQRFPKSWGEREREMGKASHAQISESGHQKVPTTREIVRIILALKAVTVMFPG